MIYEIYTSIKYVKSLTQKKPEVLRFTLATLVNIGQLAGKCIYFKKFKCMLGQSVGKIVDEKYVEGEHEIS